MNKIMIISLILVNSVSISSLFAGRKDLVDDEYKTPADRRHDRDRAVRHLHRYENEHLEEFTPPVCTKCKTCQECTGGVLW